ncbi:hypothetical protein F5144DRAFT_199256 [Chaetomium tenue]|uniref:Uncharacterized protein n=1 Tax=Chaetomium tenue TaxID=1854479 RepID=A0ACB7PDN0_9PEZI|nr:hypothetical protein F5144DRAFT_199256 [Chaetomium globosum]
MATSPARLLHYMEQNKGRIRHHKQGLGWGPQSVHRSPWTAGPGHVHVHRRVGLGFGGASRHGRAGQARCWAPFPSIFLAASQHVNFAFDEHIFSLVDTERGFGRLLHPCAMFGGRQAFVMICFLWDSAASTCSWGPSLSAAFIEIAFAAGYAGGVGILPLRFLQEFYCIHPRRRRVIDGICTLLTTSDSRWENRDISPRLFCALSLVDRDMMV